MWEHPSTAALGRPAIAASACFAAARGATFRNSYARRAAARPQLVSSFYFPKDYQMRSLIDHFNRDERGATATEYALLVVFVALAIAVGASTLGQGLSGLFSKIGTTLANAGITLPPVP